MSNTIPDLPNDTECLLKLDLAHKGLENALQAQQTELQASYDTIQQKHHYFILTAQSVLYEAMANAAREGFTEEQMQQTMDCNFH